MNALANKYWREYWEKVGVPAPEKVSAWQFGADPDYLAKLVIDGVKTATCSGHIFYELENEPLPTSDEYSVILNSADEPVAIIQNVEVFVQPMNEVPEDFAVAEGEGDRTYAYWWRAHEEFFTTELAKLDLPFKEDMLLVCERFKLIDAK